VGGHNLILVCTQVVEWAVIRQRDGLGLEDGAVDRTPLLLLAERPATKGGLSQHLEGIDHRTIEALAKDIEFLVTERIVRTTVDTS